MPTKPQTFENPGAIPSEPDERDYGLALGAGGIPEEYMPERAWKTRIHHQRKQPSCGANAAAWLNAYLLDAEAQSPRFSWLDIKSFDGHPVTAGTDMRSIFQHLKNTGTVPLARFADDTTVSIAKYADQSALDPALRAEAKANTAESYAFVRSVTFDALKEAIYRFGAVIILADIGREFWTDRKGKTSWAEKDILPLRPPTKDRSGHFTVLWGYTKDRLYGANSFSKDWGKAGHVYMTEDYLPYIREAGTVVNKADPLVVVPAYQWKRDLSYGSQGEDVRELQKALNRLGFTVSPTGPGSRGSESDYFGGLTKAAVTAYQKAKGIRPAAGYFGPVTRQSLQAAFGTGAGGTMAGMDTSKFAFLASPRFWQLFLVGASLGLTAYQQTGDWVTGLTTAIGSWFGGSVVVGTVDRAADKKVEAAAAATGAASR